ncbi:MAG: hypothetical protein HFJ80_05440 [Clostridiales bacterium]|nr:hypothetical protein [Clostridiales bacterium]
MMKKEGWMLTAGVGLLTLAAAAVCLADQPKNPAREPIHTAESAPGAKAAPAAAGYIVGAWEGRLAVFIKGDSAPSQVYDVYIATLPEEEQQRLAEGVFAAGEGELAMLLEDYTS